ncbi:1,6-anhydro-N-acetylmuramyl-L-alanine amidase AmpD [Pleionea sp. CnH1-48]|uniref:1,6-anhydro-N-acetylmuramyl-L-alanine amidase AmpD n=1 Tax=Pleionea sp. CnH1-48 TaxID=2954494 RepID=UPI0020976475|nr:1,6-anhydro-N-acetylmuramyl-L-alanine amidase AmpD [Pleionea sp. CnH1-48]MCO7223969.1 1,6-anhydro-N-acetylmuramyl-L-alanine amidase AmpD [Pleionea sp. CnH1-48]
MSLTVSNGWLTNVRHCLSSHFNQRPAEVVIDLLVIHNISLPPAQFGGGHIEAFFQGRLDTSVHPFFETIKDLRVSSHFLVMRTGEVLQFVSCDDRAWHAGVSEWQGQENCNDFSIGIELEGTDDIPYEEVQYQSLASLTKTLMLAYPQITPERIVGHSDIAPERKTDPGPAFNWSYFRRLLDGE